MERREPQLTIHNVSKTYSNGVMALHNINIEISPGMFGLLGPNGAGKSTLMRILATLQDPDTGQIFLGETDVVNQKDEVRKTLGYLPQDFGLLKNIKAEKLLDHFAVLKGITNSKIRKEVVESLLHQTNLWDKKKHTLGGFSGGMRQRFGVAVALIGNPKLLIVDEPTAGLDPAERVRFLNILSALGENSVVLLSTHIVEDVAELCTQMAIINKGEILLQAKPVEAIKELEGKIWRRMIEKDDLPLFSDKYRVISTKLFGGRTIIHIFSTEEPGEGFEPIKPDLEDVYFSAIYQPYDQQQKEVIK